MPLGQLKGHSGTIILDHEKNVCGLLKCAPNLYRRQCLKRLGPRSSPKKGGAETVAVADWLHEFIADKNRTKKTVEVPALGVYRGGKSLLLNRLMQRRAPYSNSFGVGHGQQTFTRCHGLGPEWDKRILMKW